MVEIQDGENSRWQLHIWGHQNIHGESKHTGRCPNIWEPSKHMWVSKHTGGAFKHTGMHQNILGHPNIQGVSKYKGGIQTYGWCPNIWGHPNIAAG